MTLKICASITANTSEKLKMMVEKAEKAGANLIEIRFDYLKKDYDIRKIRDLTSLPMIATNRLKEEGGLFKGKEDSRLNLLLKAASNNFDFIDIEFMTKNIEDVIQKIREIDVKIIVSSHNFSCTPSLFELNKIFKKEIFLPANVCKIVTMAKKVEDNLTCLRFVKNASKRMDTICFCIGKLGIPSRILSPLFGGFLIYASVEEGREAAPGQITIAETFKFYKLIGYDSKNH